MTDQRIRLYKVKMIVLTNQNKVNVNEFSPYFIYYSFQSQVNINEQVNQLTQTAIYKLEFIYMNSFVKKEFTLKNMPARKKTSTKIKTPSVDQFNYRILSLPQKRNTINENTLLRKKQKQKDPSYQTYGNMNVHHKLMERKNKSLPKYLYTENKEKENQKEKIQNNKNNSEYRLQTVQEILNKKDSKLIIKNSILRPKDYTPLTNKVKNQRASNLKYYFQNRKFTNLSKYNSTNDQKQRQRQKQKQRQKSNSKFKSKTKFSIHSDASGQELQEKTVRDIDLNNVIDPGVVTQENQKKQNENFVCTLQHVYVQAEKSLSVFYSEKNNKSKHYQQNEQKTKDKEIKYVQIALGKLKHIEKHVGDMSKKTLLLLGRCYFQLKKYDDSIRYFQKVFREVNYNLFKLKIHNQNYKHSISQSSNIYSKRTQQLKRLQTKKYEQCYELLAQSYKRTQNFLCAIKILDQWEHFIVQRQIKNQIKLKNQSQNLQQSYLKNQYRQKTISYLDEGEVNKLKKYSSNHNCSYYQYEIMKTNLQLSQRKKSLSKHENQASGSIIADRIEQNFKTVQPKMSYSVISSQKYFALLQHLSVYEKRSQFYKGYLTRARLHYEMKNYQNAIKDYNKAITCKQLNLQANLQLGSVYYKIGRGDKSISLYNQFQQKIINHQHIQNKKILLDYIKFHKSVMYIKMNQLKQANHALTQIEQNLTSKQLLSEILYYKGFILLNHGIYDEALIQLQKSINYSTSEKYIVYAYFLRIYIHFFKFSDYYGAQYEIDRMKFTINSQKINVHFDQVKLDELHGFYSLLDMMVLTSAIICILKMKLSKGVMLLTKLENKFAILTHSNLEYEKSVQLFQIIQLIYQFMYFSYYTKRQFKKSLSYLVLLQSCTKRSRLTNLNNFLLQKNELQKQQSVAQAQKINHLTLESIIMMSEKKYQLALQKIKQIQTIMKSSNSSNSINLSNKNSLSLNFLNKEDSIQKDDNYLSMIKSICYIQLYDYLEKEQNAKKQKEKHVQEKNLIQNNNKKTIQYDQFNKFSYSKTEESNTQILLSAEDLLAHCLITEKENCQILFLIAAIHYELKQYESSLNYIRQAIQYSDDHMIKHYYLKANLKLLLGRYEQAAKDFGNAITVYKQIQKQAKNEQNLLTSDNLINQISLEFDQQQHQVTENTLEIKLNQDGDQLTQLQSSLTSDKNCEYYQQKQEMIWQIYLNRAIAYLKYSYQIQSEAQKFTSNRESINSMRQMAGQDIKTYFNHFLKQIKKLSPKQSSQKQLNNQSKSTQARYIKLSQKSLNITEVTKQQKNKVKLQKLKRKLQANIELLSLLMHTPSIQSYIQISKDFLSVGYKIVTDQELLKYFYMAKELNNCLLMMEKIIKRSQNNLKQGQNDVQPFFKSKNKKVKRQSLNYQVNPTPFLSANKIQKLKFDHCVLNALKESSNNSEQYYQSALTSLLQCVEKIAQQKLKFKNSQQNEFCGQIFKWGDLLFFTGAMYFMLNEYESSVKYFLQSLNQNLNNGTLYTGKNYIKHLIQDQDHEFEMDSIQIDIQALRLLEQLFQNRTYMKQEIEYNIGISYLMMKQYKQAYNYLSIYPKFVDLIQIELSQYQDLLKKENQKNFSAQFSKLKKSNKEKDYNSYENRNQEKQKTLSQQGQEDIMPFPCHNRLCSIYTDKNIKNKVFKLSFCLPKIQLPKLSVFHQKQVEMASLIDINKSQSETIFAESHLKYNESQQFLIQKEKVINFIEVISLSDIEMKPLAPWIKKQKKYIKFTQNILQESIDLKTECNTGRSKRKHSKQLFGKQKQKEKQKSAQVALCKKQKKPAQRYVELQAREEA